VCHNPTVLISPHQIITCLVLWKRKACEDTITPMTRPCRICQQRWRIHLKITMPSVML
jgi:hypothetical protein